MSSVVIILLAVVILYLLVLWHSRRTTYQCPECKKKFKISFLKDFVSPHWPTRSGHYKYLKCPNCKKRVKAKEVID